MRVPNAQAQSGGESEVSFIAGKVISITFKKELSSIDANDNLTMANLYIVKLGDVDVINGGFDGDDITLALTATHKSSIGRAGEIYVVLQKNENGSFDALYWGVPNKVACIPKEKIKELGLAGELEDMHEIARSFCEIY